MKVDIVTSKKLFQQDVQYEIPVFQREYVWTLEDQWEALWEDIQDTAEDYLKHLDEVDRRAQAQQRTRKHFMGAVVLQQKLEAIAETQKCLVIDGQQRLTTVQLLLKGAQDVFTGAFGEGVARNLRQLVSNQFGEGDNRFKLWPAGHDRDAFRYVMTGGQEGAKNSSSRIIEAHTYFRAQIREWLDSKDNIDDNLKAHALETTLLGLFEFVTIDLTPDDDPNTIFEVLNARGTPLSAGDLIKNHILHAATYENCADELYKDVWSYFLDPWWSKEIRQGALVRTQLDIFLNYWLASVVADEVKSHRVFPRFEDYVKTQLQQEDSSIRGIANEMLRYGKIYRGWYQYADDLESEYCHFFRRGWECGLGGMSPLILWLFSQPEHVLAKSELHRTVKDIESFLIRRALCRVITAGLNRLSVLLVQQVREVEKDQIRSTLIASLRGGRGAARWPTDDEVRQAVLDQPMYGRIGVRKIRLILGALERRMRDDDTYSQALTFDERQLTIEHVMPRSWHSHWKLSDEVSHEVGEARRDRLVDSLGNLTLLTSKLNAHLSNSPWPNKRAGIDEHPGLYLNRDLVKMERWTDRDIQDRGERMLEDILRTWPYPQATSEARTS